MTAYFVKDAEAAVYAIECALCFFESMTSNNYGQATLDLVGLFGWVKNAF